MTDLNRFSLPAAGPAGGGWCVYLVLCGGNRLYCGITNQPEARFAAHAAGKGAKFTRMHKPLAMRLVYVDLPRSDAAKLEPQIKKLKAAQKQELWALLAEYLVIESD